MTSGLEDDLREQIDDSPGATYKLILNKWSFVFKRVPNSHDYYFDIVAEDYSIQETNTILEVDDFPTKLADDDEVRYFKF